MIRQVERLVMMGARERTQSGCDCVVTPRLNLDVVRRVGNDQINCGAVKQAVDVLSPGRIATQESMIAQNPQIARAGKRLVGRSGN